MLGNLFTTFQCPFLTADSVFSIKITSSILRLSDSATELSDVSFTTTPAASAIFNYWHHVENTCAAGFFRFSRRRLWKPPCSLVEVHRCFRGEHSFHHQDDEYLWHVGLLHDYTVPYPWRRTRAAAVTFMGWLLSTLLNYLNFHPDRTILMTTSHEYKHTSDTCEKMSHE